MTIVLPVCPYRVDTRLQVNIVDLSGHGLSNCVAEATQGRVYNSQNIATLNQAFLQSTAEFSQQSCD